MSGINEGYLMAVRVKEADPRVRRTHKLLVDAFERLLKKKSISAITVQDIAEEATVNRATFYAHFEDKYAFLDSWVREAFKRVLAEKLPASPSLSARNLHLLIQAVFDFLAGFYGGCKRSDRQLEPMFETAMQEELYELILGWLRQVPSSERRPREMLETTAMVISWAIFGPAVQWSRGDRYPTADEMSSRVMTIVVNALSDVIDSIPS